MNLSDKITARKSAKEIRDGICGEEKTARDARIVSILVDSDAYKKADKLLLYAAVKSEPDLSTLADIALKDGKTVAYPHCLDKNAMVFRAVKSVDELTVGKYSIPEPPQTCPEITDFSHTLCVVPGLTFTKDGDRLGYGGGYYDRFLSRNACITVGVTYRELIADALPKEPTDVKVDAVVFA